MPNGGHGGGGDDDRKRKGNRRRSGRRCSHRRRLQFQFKRRQLATSARCTDSLLSSLCLPNLKNGATRRFAKEEGGGGNSEHSSVHIPASHMHEQQRQRLPISIYLCLKKKCILENRFFQAFSSWQAPKATEARQAMGKLLLITFTSKREKSQAFKCRADTGRHRRCRLLLTASEYEQTANSLCKEREREKRERRYHCRVDSRRFTSGKASR